MPMAVNANDRLLENSAQKNNGEAAKASQQYSKKQLSWQIAQMTEAFTPALGLGSKLHTKTQLHCSTPFLCNANASFAQTTS